MLGKHEKKHHFLKRAKLVASHLGVAKRLIPHTADHLHQFARGRSPIIWLQGQNCTGCSVSLLNSDHFNPVDLDHFKMSFRYQPDIESASGYKAIEVIEETEAEMENYYVLVVEGAIPTGENALFCTFGLEEGTKQVDGNTVPRDRDIYSWVKELAPGAAAVIAIGNCATFGGIPAANAEVTGATAVPEIIAEIDEEKPVINVSGCPPHPDWIMGSIVDVLLWLEGKKDAPELDEQNRLKVFYGAKIHDNCERKKAFTEKKFLMDWNESKPDEGRCLLKMGCRGPKTYADCPIRRWNSATSWCVGVNGPCQGCSESGFYKQLPHRIPK